MRRCWNCNPSYAQLCLSREGYSPIWTSGQKIVSKITANMCSLQGGFLGRVSPETRKDAIGSGGGGGGGLCGGGSCWSYSPSASSPVLLLFFLPVLSSFGGCGGILHRQLASEPIKFDSASAFSRRLFSLKSQKFECLL